MLFVLLLLPKVIEAARGPWMAGIQTTGVTSWALRNNSIALVVFGIVGPGMAAAAGAEGLAAAMLLCSLLTAWLLYREASRHLEIRLWDRS